MSVPIRLNKLLAQLGVGSRRACEQLAYHGRITVNNLPITKNVLVHRSNDVVKIDNIMIPLNQQLQPCMYMYNKPIGEIVAYKSHTNPLQPTQSYTTIYHTINTKYQHIVSNKRLIYCGRLDLTTTGLLLLTTNPAIATHMTTSTVKRIYNVIATVPNTINSIINNYTSNNTLIHDKVIGIPQYMIEQISRVGITIDDVRYKPIQIKLTHTTPNHNELHYTVELIEGKNREIRRLFQYFNLYIKSLTRIQYGDYILPNTMKPGELRQVPISSMLQHLVDGTQHPSPSNQTKHSKSYNNSNKRYETQTT